MYFAMSVEKEYGKNEMWYIMDCDEDAFVYCGFKEDITKEEIKNQNRKSILLQMFLIR